MHFHLTYFPFSLHSDGHFLELYSVTEPVLVWSLLKKVLVSSSEILVFFFAFATSKRRASGKRKQAPILLPNLRLESKSIKSFVPFWNEMYLMHYEHQASLCSVISKLSRRGCWFFSPSQMLSTLPGRQTVKACVSKAWNTGICEDTQISLAVLAEGERGVHRQQKMA